MKKAIFFLILMILLGGTGFYFGWVQITIPEHHYGVMFTKTGGYEPEAVAPGTFIWKAEKLIPTNFTLHLFDLSPVGGSMEVSGVLPSGELYAQALPDPVSFEYRLSFTISYRIDPAQLPRLVEASGLTPESLGEWYEARNAGILEAASQAAAAADTEESGPGSFAAALKERIGAQYPEIILMDAGITSFEYPDYDLYRAAKSMYLEKISALKQAETEAEAFERQWVVSRKAKLAVLEEYGRLLSEYPGLLQLVLAEQATEGIDLPSLRELLNSEQEAGTVKQ